MVRAKKCRFNPSPTTSIEVVRRQLSMGNGRIEGSEPSVFRVCECDLRNLLALAEKSA